MRYLLVMAIFSAYVIITTMFSVPYVNSVARPGLMSNLLVFGPLILAIGLSYLILRKGAKNLKSRF